MFITSLIKSKVFLSQIKILSIKISDETEELLDTGGLNKAMVFR
jgi:hypothetical protein